MIAAWLIWECGLIAKSDPTLSASAVELARDCMDCGGAAARLPRDNCVMHAYAIAYARGPPVRQGVKRDGNVFTIGLLRNCYVMTMRLLRDCYVIAMS